MWIVGRKNSFCVDGALELLQCPYRRLPDLLMAAHVCLQDLLYVWTEPKLCMGGVPLPEKRTVQCENMDFFIRLSASMGAMTAVLLVILTCYFWKKNKRSKHRPAPATLSIHSCFQMRVRKWGFEVPVISLKIRWHFNNPRRERHILCIKIAFFCTYCL